MREIRMKQNKSERHNMFNISSDKLVLNMIFSMNIKLCENLLQNWIFKLGWWVLRAHSEVNVSFIGLCNCVPCIQGMSN